MSYPISPIPHNLDHLQGMLPYINYQLMDNYNDQFPVYNPFLNQKNIDKNNNQTEVKTKIKMNQHQKKKLKKKKKKIIILIY